MIDLHPDICPHCLKKPNCRKMMIPCADMDKMRINAVYGKEGSQ